MASYLSQRHESCIKNKNVIVTSQIVKWSTQILLKSIKLKTYNLHMWQYDVSWVYHLSYSLTYSCNINFSVAIHVYHRPNLMILLLIDVVCDTLQINKKPNYCTYMFCMLNQNSLWTTLKNHKISRFTPKDIKIKWHIWTKKNLNRSLSSSMIW